MITIKTFVFNPFQENTYILSDESGSCIIIDAGCYQANEYDLLHQYIKTNNLIPEKLINTHGHIDHILGVKQLSDKYKIPFYIHAKEQLILDQANMHAALYGFSFHGLPEKIDNFDESGSISFGNSTLKVLYVPGHSKGSVALYSPNDNFVITGDVLFKGSIGRSDLPGGDYDELMNSITTQLLVLDQQTLVFPGHGPYSSIGIEIKTNPFL